jgi:hypothetical protein
LLECLLSLAFLLLLSDISRTWYACIRVRARAGVGAQEFVEAKAQVKDKPNEFVRVCMQLLEAPRLEAAVQVRLRARMPPHVGRTLRPCQEGQAAVRRGRHMQHTPQTAACTRVCLCLAPLHDRWMHARTPRFCPLLHARSAPCPRPRAVVVLCVHRASSASSSRLWPRAKAPCVMRVCHCTAMLHCATSCLARHVINMLCGDFVLCATLCLYCVCTVRCSTVCVCVCGRSRSATCLPS